MSNSTQMMTGTTQTKPTNIAARNLSDRRYRPQVVRPRKGKGSYTRNSNKVR